MTSTKLQRDPEHVLFDLAMVLDRVGGDEDLLREIASIFLEEYPSLLEDIRAAIVGGDPARLERAAHSLKGSVSNFGAHDVTQAAADLELLGRKGEIQSAAPALLRLEAQLQMLDPALTELVGGRLE